METTPQPVYSLREMLSIWSPGKELKSCKFYGVYDPPFRAKLRQNAENTCALLTMANNGLAATLTNDQGKLHSVLSRVEPGGEIKVIFMVSVRLEST